MELNAKLSLIGNIVHESCIDSLDEKDNVRTKLWWPQGKSQEIEEERRKAIVDGKGIYLFNPGILILT